MVDKARLDTVIGTCVDAANRLRTAANSVTDARIRSVLSEGSQHIEQCIRRCQDVRDRV